MLKLLYTLTILVIVGDGAVGATVLLNRFVHGRFVDNGYVPTVFDTISSHYVHKGIPISVK